jgi:hypothetical protein
MQTRITRFVPASRRLFLLIPWLIIVVGTRSIADDCHQTEAVQFTQDVPIFDGKTLENWLIIEDSLDFKEHGKISVEAGVICLGRGIPATGMSWKKELPTSNYEITFSGRRMDGNDFFCGLTFPVKEEYCTLILGGWGGRIVGLSNIDGSAAVDNETTQVIEFEKEKWYSVRLRVTDDAIQVWLENKRIIHVPTKGHKFSIWWEQEPVRPLGIVTWYTAAELKDLKMMRATKSSGAID